MRGFLWSSRSPSSIVFSSTPRSSMSIVRLVSSIFSLSPIKVLKKKRLTLMAVCSSWGHYASRSLWFFVQGAMRWAMRWAATLFDLSSSLQLGQIHIFRNRYDPVSILLSGLLVAMLNQVYDSWSNTVRTTDDRVAPPRAMTNVIDTGRHSRSKGAGHPVCQVLYFK
jgi:hypothetical protein